jgi:cell division protein FtsQ
MVFKAAAAFGVLCFISAGFVLIYDIITQHDYFNTKSLIITGNQNFSDNQVIGYAGLKKGTNIFSVNLSIVRKRLLAHPWIENARISRKFPSGIKIRIKEHKAVAIADLGRRYFINDKGEIFKECDVEDPGVLPIIKGLRYSDISILPRSHLDGSDESGTTLLVSKHRNPFKAVMDVLRLGQRAESVLPNELIRQIMVDREIGLTVYAFNKIKEIKLGYENYADKYDLLKKVLLYIKNINTFQDPVSIDLNNLNRAVVNLAR